MTEFVTVFEMGPRDGLQNEKRQIPLQAKVALVDMLSDCGFRKIEVGSFINPKWVPQMADSNAVLSGIHRRDEIRYTALTPNLRGYESARTCGVDEVAIFGSASEAFSQKNINCSVAESLKRFESVLDSARADGVPVRGYVSCVTDCPYSGPVEPSSVAELVQTLLRMGCYEVSLGDTIGSGTPDKIDAMLSAVLDVAPPSCLAGHYHDTNGMALENIVVSLAHGLRTFDAAIGGLGGCPYAPGAKGNVATEAVMRFLHQNGYATRLNEAALQVATHYASTLRRAA
jgi:hydroxymethylglutaryl-CoA lyase